MSALTMVGILSVVIAGINAGIALKQDINLTVAWLCVIMWSIIAITRGN
jgi:hypothetical protein